MSQRIQDPQWSQNQPLDTMDLHSQDYGNLLDFQNIDFAYTLDFDGQDSAPNDQQLSDLADSLSSQHLPSSGVVQPQQHDVTAGIQQQSHDDFFDFNFHAPYDQGGQQQSDFSMPRGHAIHSRGVVPPTPNSVEMQGGAARYLHQMDAQTRAIYEQHYQPRKEDVANFTPLVSPAVTPHDNHFQFLPEFTVPGAYFSPLTSPALEAQNHGHHGPYPSHPTTAETSITTSPIDLDVDMLEEATVSQELAPKAKRKSGATPRSSVSSGRVRQSPIVKPQQRRRGGHSTTIPAKDVTALLEEAQEQSERANKPATAGSNLRSSRDGSGAESISPEPLSESLMGPPPRPGSITTSPMIFAQGSNQSSISMSEGQGMCPATPASLMRIQASPNSVPHSGSQSNTPSFVPQSGAQPLMDDFALPEAATSSTERPRISRVDTAIQDDQSTPRLPARKTPKMGPLSTPSGPLASPGLISPSVSAIDSPTSTTGHKKSQTSGRGIKKRNSINSTLVSPALRPKISPNIKPLLPQGAHISEDMHTSHLARNSNYQNILNGTCLPGVSYPEALSTNLTSKRTSHKLAEQGRRNRINVALQELQVLIPSPKLLPKDAAGEDIAVNGSGSLDMQEKEKERQSNSKASTVENAIEYIKFLKKKDEEKDRRMAEQLAEIQALKKILEAGSAVMSPVAEKQEKRKYVEKQDTDMEMATERTPEKAGEKLVGEVGKGERKVDETMTTN